jgi:GNAT superfamily N-acetyltransferase
MNEGKFLLLHRNHDLVACVFVKVTGDRTYLGTLSVDPALQKSGLGTRMMAEAEAYARAAGCKALDIRIINLRTELALIYRKFGFVETGIETLEHTKGFTQPVYFITMSKTL